VSAARFYFYAIINKILLRFVYLILSCYFLSISFILVVETTVTSDQKK